MATTLLVTGGHGFLGRRVCRLATEAGLDVVAPTSAELDVRDPAAVEAAMRSAGVDAVVHLAYRRTERDTIVDGSAAVARAAAASGARLVHLSTDVVFGGRDSAYVESDQPHPIEPYGAAKAEAESLVASITPQAALVRTSLLLSDGVGDDDLGQPELDALGAARGEVTFTFFTDEIRCPARAVDVATGVIGLINTHRDLSGPVHLAGPEALDRATLARRIVSGHGYDPARLVTSTAEAAGLAGRRPGRIELDITLATSLGLRCRPI